MRTAILLVLLLAAASVSAATLEQSDYIIVVGRNAPASDVVLGANFAASMKATLGVTYASALDSEAYSELSDDDLAGKTIVVIDGQRKYIKILGDDRTATDYWEEQGFTVDTVDEPRRADLLLGTTVQRTPDQAPREDEADEQETGAVDESPAPPPPPPRAPELTRQQTPPQPAPQLEVESNSETNTTAVVPSVEPPTPEPKGFFARIAGWFADLF